MQIPEFSTGQWVVAVLAALSIGLAKSGLAGFGMLPVLLMAEILPARQSTGVVLPLLICGDIFAVSAFRKHAQWKYIWRLVPPALLGIVAGYFLMKQRIPNGAFRAIIGWIVLVMVGLHYLHKARPGVFERIPHTRWFAWLMGGWSGATTMVANAAGPVMTLYLLAVNLPKFEFVGTSAWFFLMINCVKVPFSYELGLINDVSLSFNAVLIPAVGLGILIGRRLIAIIPQKLFEQFALVFAAIASIRLILY